MIIPYIKNIIKKNYNHFDDEQKRNLFVLYVINLLLPITIFPWIFFYIIYETPILTYSQIIYIFIFLILYISSAYRALDIKWYRFLMIVTSMLMLPTPTFLTGKECLSIVGLFFVPIGMILCFSTKEKNIYIKYLIFITAYFFSLLFWVFSTSPILIIESAMMENINKALLINFIVAALIMSYIFFNENSQMQSNLQLEKTKSDKLLLKIFPESIADRLKWSPSSIVDTFGEVTVIFIDIVNFTQYSDNLKPSDLVYMLDDLFSAFDAVANKYQIEKIKTIGDAYMAVSGLPKQNPKHHLNAANFVLEINKLVKEQIYPKYNIQIRIGMHTGSVTAGVIGRSKFSYDLWGSTVNIASRFESNGAMGKIHITKEMKELLHKEFEIVSNGLVKIKGLGQKESYFLGGKLVNRKISIPLSNA